MSGLRAWISNGYHIGNTIYLWVRNEDGSKTLLEIKGFKPYFYIKSRFGDYKGLFGEKLDKIEVEDPSMVRELREKYGKTWEADIPFVRRFLIDKRIKTFIMYNGVGDHITLSKDDVRRTGAFGYKPRIWYLDIEVYAETFPEPDMAEYPVINIGIYDTYLGKYIELAYHPDFAENVFESKYMGEPAEIRTYDSEESLLNDYIRLYNNMKPDIITGWNISFDRDYLRNRARNLGINFRDNIADYFDLLSADRMINSRRSHVLKHVTVDEGIESYEEAREAADVLPSWKDNPVDIVKYNLRDVWRILMLDRKYDYINNHLAYKDLVGLVHIEDTLYKKVIVDTLCLRVAKKRGVVLPTTVRRESKRYRGAVVLKPVPGLIEGVAVFDMSKYYPSIIISFNVSPETKKRVVDKGNNIWEFDRSRKGLIPEAVESVIRLENKLREEQSRLSPDDPEYMVLEKKIMAAKGTRNSFYGVMGTGKFRLYDVDCASTITGLAREGILYIVEQAKKLGYRVVYGDTDSIFVEVDFDKAEKLIDELNRRVRRYFMERYGLEKEPDISLKFEKYYRRILFTRAQKRYAGWLVWKKGKETDKIDITGFEAVRSDTPPFTEYAERRVFELILREGYNPEKLDQLVSELKREFRERPLREIALYKGISKPLDEYSSDSPHVRAAKYSNLYLGTRFGKGSKVRYVYVERAPPGLPDTDVVAFESEDQLRGFVVDYDRMIEMAVINPLERIFSALGYRYGVSHRRWW